MLTVYVDDFKLAGPAGNLKEGWRLISDYLDVEKPGGLGLYLGCKHEREEMVVDGNPLTVMRYNCQGL